MPLDRRTFIVGLAAPAVIRTPGLLMPIKPWRESFMLSDYPQYVAGWFLNQKTGQLEYYQGTVQGMPEP